LDLVMVARLVLIGGTLVARIAAVLTLLVAVAGSVC